MIMMNLVSFIYHALIFLLGILISIPFALLLIYLFTSRFSNESVYPLLFPTKTSKTSLLAFPSNDQSTGNTWMLALFTNPHSLSGRNRLQGVYVKLYQSYLFLHFTSKPLKHLYRKPIAFSHVIIFDILQSEIRLKPFEQSRTQYWSNKTPLVLSRIRYLMSYRIVKKLKKHQTNDDTQEREKNFLDCLRPIDFQWIVEKDEIYLYALTRRAKEEWFYRLRTAQNHHHFSTMGTIPLEQIELYYDRKAKNQRSVHPHQLRSASTWPVLIQSMVDRLSFSPIHQRLHSTDEDYLLLINQTIYRCTRNFDESFHLRTYFQRKIEHELRHLKLPSYVQWIRLSNFSLDNTYPSFDRLKNIWWNEQGLWTAMDLTYQGNISFEFTIKINVIDSNALHHQSIFRQIVSNIYKFLPDTFKEVFALSDRLQILTNMINTMLMITIHIRRIHGILLFNIPLPPSDRLWFVFEEMPLIDFDVQHQQISSNQQESSPKDSLKDLNQLQMTINHLLSRWIEKQFKKEFVFPNLRDVVLRWSSDPLMHNAKKNLLVLSTSSTRNHLFWYRNDDLQLSDRRRKHKVKTNTKEKNEKKKIYLIAQWKKKRHSIKVSTRKRSSKLIQSTLLFPKRSLLTDRYFLLEHYY